MDSDDLSLVFSIMSGSIEDLNFQGDNLLKDCDEHGRCGRSFVLGLRAIKIKKLIIAVGSFSLFEQFLQNTLCLNGKDSTKSKILRILIETKNEHLKEDFEYIYSVINTLKHGKGSSHENLLKTNNLSFDVKKNYHDYFSHGEGNLDDISTLLEADNVFLKKMLLTMDKVQKEAEKYMEGINKNY